MWGVPFASAMPVIEWQLAHEASATRLPSAMSCGVANAARKSSPAAGCAGAAAALKLGRTAMLASNATRTRLPAPHHRTFEKMLQGICPSFKKNTPQHTGGYEKLQSGQHLVTGTGPDKFLSKP